jgi:hypothetical protein
MDGIGFVIRFTELVEIVTKSYYSAIANSHNLRFTKICGESFQMILANLVGALKWNLSLLLPLPYIA